MTQTSIEHLPLAIACERFEVDDSTLRLHIKEGRLPAVKIRGRVHIATTDLEAYIAPKPMSVGDGTLKDWAERMAAKAPMFRPEQRDVIVSAFASALAGVE